jgi:hypothetical protein
MRMRLPRPNRLRPTSEMNPSTSSRCKGFSGQMVVAFSMFCEIRWPKAGWHRDWRGHPIARRIHPVAHQVNDHAGNRDVHPERPGPARDSPMLYVQLLRHDNPAASKKILKYCRLPSSGGRAFSVSILIQVPFRDAIRLLADSVANITKSLNGAASNSEPPRNSPLSLRAALLRSR